MYCVTSPRFMVGVFWVGKPGVGAVPGVFSLRCTRHSNLHSWNLFTTTVYLSAFNCSRCNPREYVRKGCFLPCTTMREREAQKWWREMRSAEFLSAIILKLRNFCLFVDVRETITFETLNVLNANASGLSHVVHRGLFPPYTGYIVILAPVYFRRNNNAVISRIIRHCRANSRVSLKCAREKAGSPIKRVFMR